jgi:hypothetical protein
MLGQGPTFYNHNYYKPGFSLVSLAAWEEGEKRQAKNRNLVPVHKRQGV